MRLRALLIDPFHRDVSLVKINSDPNDWQSITAFTGGDLSEVMLQPADSRGPGLVLFCDDEGLTRPDQRFWCFRQHPKIVYGGRCVIACCDEQGDLVPGVADAASVEASVRWLNVRFVGYATATEDHPGLIVIHRQPIFEEIQ